MFAGGSAREKAASLRVEAAALREQAELRDHEAQQWAKGSEGELRVGRELERAESHGWTTLHDRLVRSDESKANLDHLAVGPGGVVLIDSKNWSAGAWLHDDMLFRNGPTGPVPCRSELAHIRHDAAAVSSAIGAQVTSVLCLSGTNAGRVTRPVLVAGVHVMPVGRLAAFLRSLPTRAADTAGLADQLQRCFPTACAAPPPAATRDRPRSVNSSSAPFSPKRSGRSAGPGRKPKPTRALIAVGVLLVLLVGGARLVAALGSAASAAIHRAATAPAAPRFVSPCASITDAQVAHAVGRPVYRFTTSATDTCRWGYSRPPSVYSPADIEIQTGWMVKYVAEAAHGHAQAKHQSSSEQLLVPQFVAVPGSAAPASSTTQPMEVTVDVGAGVTRPVAQRAVRTLAQLTGSHMPTGPGSTKVSPYR